MVDNELFINRKVCEVMKLKNLLKIIDDYQYFQLFKGDRIGRFVKNDLGIEPYLEEEVWNIQVEDEVLEIALKY